MVKYLYQPTLDMEYWTQAYHFGGTARDDPLAWHAIFAYWFYEEFPPWMTALWPIQHLTRLDADLHARMLASLPTIVRDTCPYCWDDDYFWLHTPAYPRYNIYRGQTRLLVPPTILWDARLPDAPPGFTYHY